MEAVLFIFIFMVLFIFNEHGLEINIQNLSLIFTDYPQKSDKKVVCKKLKRYFCRKVAEL